jgi:Flp pilus assembly protein TadD
LELFRGARLYRSGTHALDAGEIDHAILDLEQAATLAPAASEIQNHLGLAYWADGRPEEAFSAFERAIALDCENEAAQENLRALERSVQDASANPWATHSATKGENPSGR